MRKKLPLVTISIPFYNDSKYLAFAIQSVLNQTYTNWELLLIDDGSSDDSLQIANNYRDHRITVLSDGKNLGLATRLNESIRLANGVFYARMDADDIMAVDRIEKQIAYLMDNPHVDVVGTSAHVIDASNRIIGGVQFPKITKPKTLSDILGGAGFVHPSIMGKTEWFRNNPYDERLRRNQDRGLWLKTVEKSSFVYLHERWLFYRMMGDSSIRKELRSFGSNRTLYFKILYSEMGKKVLALKMYFVTLIKLVARITLLVFNQKKLLAKSRYVQYADTKIVELEKEIKKAIQ